jgi:hypothetical protein
MSHPTDKSPSKVASRRSVALRWIAYFSPLVFGWYCNDAGIIEFGKSWLIWTTALFATLHLLSSTVVCYCINKRYDKRAPEIQQLAINRFIQFNCEFDKDTQISVCQDTERHYLASNLERMIRYMLVLLVVSGQGWLAVLLASTLTASYLECKLLAANTNLS